MVKEQKEQISEKTEKNKKEKRGKRIRTGRKHESPKQYKFYEIKDETLIRKRKPCPRCGPGTWLAEHKDRVYCGRCNYTEFERK